MRELQYSLRLHCSPADALISVERILALRVLVRHWGQNVITNYDDDVRRRLLGRASK